VFSRAVVITGLVFGFHRLAPSNAATLAGHPAGPELALILDETGFSRSVTQRQYNLQVPPAFSTLLRLPLSNATVNIPLPAPLDKFAFAPIIYPGI
jgi:hypothetical protein